jgi:acetyl esterase/lipase
MAAQATPGLAPAAQPGERYRDPVFAGAMPRVEQNIVYGRAIDKPTGNEVELLLDYYDLAEDTAPDRAVFVFVHGGGFRGGSKRTGQQYAQQLVQYGFVVLSITYRVSQGDQWGDSMPAAVADARQALRWLHAEAESRRLDTDRVFMGGTSAGAITSLMVAYTDVSRGADPAAPDAPEATDPIDVAGVVDWWGGLYDHIDDMSAGGPPLMIVHGTEDPTVPFEQATMLKARAEEVGIPLAWYPVEGARHGPHNAQRDVPRLTTFFWDQVFDAEAPPDGPTATSEPPMPTVEPTAPPEPTDEPTPTRAAPDGSTTLFLPAALRNAPLVDSSPHDGPSPVGTAVPQPTAPPPDLADVPMRRAFGTAPLLLAHGEINAALAMPGDPIAEAVLGWLDARMR